MPSRWALLREMQACLLSNFVTFSNCFLGIQHRAGLLWSHPKEKHHKFSQGDAVYQVLEQSG